MEIQSLHFMGNQTNLLIQQEKLYGCIESNDIDKLKLILDNHPGLAHKKFLNQSHTPLIRAIWKTNYAIVRILLGEFKADPNQFGGAYNPLMMAAIKSNIDIFELLKDYNAHLQAINTDSLNALDVAVLFGNYRMAHHIRYTTELKPKKCSTVYERINKKYRIRYINYEMVLQLLESKIFENRAEEEVYVRPIAKLKNPVPDPRESWKSKLNRVHKFQPPRLVQKDDLLEKPLNCKGYADFVDEIELKQVTNASQPSKASSIPFEFNEND